MKQIRVFVAHSKGTDDEVLAGLLIEVQRLMDHAAAGRAQVEVVLGRDHYNANAARCGGWDGWAREVALGIHPTTREPVFTGYVVPEGPIGKATATILTMALQAGKAVLALRAGGLVRAHAIAQVDPEDYKSGWRLA